MGPTPVRECAGFFVGRWLTRRVVVMFSLTVASLDFLSSRSFLTHYDSLSLSLPAFRHFSSLRHLSFGSVHMSSVVQERTVCRCIGPPNTGEQKKGGASLLRLSFDGKFSSNRRHRDVIQFAGEGGQILFATPQFSNSYIHHIKQHTRTHLFRYT